MTQFGSSTPGGSVQRAGSRGVSVGGLSESIQVAPVPVAVANTGNLITLATLDKILSITGQAFGAVNVAIARKTAEANHHNAQVDMMDRALANRHARTDAAQFGDMIDSGSLRVPDGVPIDEFSERVVADEMAKSFDNPSDAYKQEYKDLAPVLAEKFYAKQRADRRQAQADNLDLMTDRVYAAKSVAEINEAVSFSVANFQVTERQAQATLIIPAMRQAARTGDADKVDLLAQALPDGAFAGDVQQLKLAAAAELNQRQIKTWQQGEDVLQSLLDAGVPTTQVRDSIAELYDNGQLAPGKAEQWRHLMDAKDAQAQSVAKSAMIDTIASMRLSGASREQLQPMIDKLESVDASAALTVENQIQEAESRAQRQRVEQEKVLFKQGAVSEGLAAAGTGFLGSVRDTSILASDGKTELNISAKEIQQSTLETAFAQIDAEELQKAGGNYGAAFQTAQARKVRLVGANGIMPESFKQTITAGATAANPQILLEGNPPPATVAAYSLYRQMLADAPAVAERAAEGKAKELFDNAAILQSDFKDKNGNDDVAGALAAAARNVYGDPLEKAAGLDRLKQADVAAAAKSITGRSIGEAIAYNATGGIIPFVPGAYGRARNDVKNQGEVEAMIRTRAAVYMPTKSPEEAVRIATARVKQQGQVVDGWWVNLPGDVSDSTKSALPTVVADKADEWVKTNANSGVDRGSIRATMEPSGRFVLIDNSTGFPLSPPVVMSAQEIDAAFSEKRRKEVNKTVQAKKVAPDNPAAIQRALEAKPPRRYGRNVLE